MTVADGTGEDAIAIDPALSRNLAAIARHFALNQKPRPREPLNPDPVTQATTFESFSLRDDVINRTAGLRQG